MPFLLGLLVLILPTAAPDTGGTITPLEAYAMVVRGEAALFDVREADEVAHGMAAPATWLPLSRIEAEPAALPAALAALPAGRTAIFYCAAGRRAARAVEKTLALGRPALNMGGFAAWKHEGLPVKPG
jgi:rhodanese-related sulfurtransferase